MKLLIKDQLSSPEKEVILSLRYSSDGVYLCGEDKEGRFWYLMEITDEGARMIGSIDPTLGFSLDESGRLFVTWSCTQ